MNKRQKREVNRLLRVKAFLTVHAPDFTNTPARNGDAKYASAHTAINTLIPQITGKQAEQASGSFGQASADQGGERADLLTLMRIVNSSARVLAVDLDDPGIVERFRMPALNSDLQLAAAGDAFADAIEELNLASAFNDHGYEGDMVIDLRAEAQEMRDAETAQGGALSGQAGATAALPGLLKLAAHHVQCLDLVVKNRYRDNAEVLGAWKTAKHVVRDGDDDEEPPAPPAPPPP